MIDFNFAIKNRGECRLNQVLITPKLHDDINDLFFTIEEEIIHQILTENFGTTEDQDHFIIRKLGFIDDWINE